MAIERKPSNPIPQTFIPPLSLPHRVQDGESWETIARDNHIHPCELVDFNFKTLDPEEVNWYLREYVGCNRETPDHKNYMFASSDTPGIVRIPVPMPKFTVVPPYIERPSPQKKIVMVGYIEKEILFAVDSFGAPGSVRWSGSKYIIHEEYESIPKDFVERGTAKGPRLDYIPTAFSKTSIHRYKVLWGPRHSTAQQLMNTAERGAWFIVKTVTNQHDGATGTKVYGSWDAYPRSSTDPLNKFRPKK